jgi:hypothetical protein
MSQLKVRTHLDQNRITVAAEEIENAINQATITQQTATSYTLALADLNTWLRMSNASAQTLTIPANATLAIPVGSWVDIEQAGAGQLTVAAAGGVTINGPHALAFAAQFAKARLTKLTTNSWNLT